MINIKFINKYGTIAMGGRDHPSHKILEADGLELPDVTRNVVSYYDEPGQVLLNEHTDARTITLSVDIVNNGGLSRELARMIKILGAEGELIIRSGIKKRKITAKCTSFKPSRRNEWVQKVVMQFICDYPYFSDFEDTNTAIYKTVPLLKNPFTLPMIFSNRIYSAMIDNKGDVKCEPVIYLRGGENVINGLADNTVVIKNNTTNQHIVIEYELSQNEVLTVDIPNRRIYSSKNIDILIYCISNDTFLSDFYLAEGENEIEVLCNTEREVTAVIEYNNRYLEAVT